MKNSTSADTEWNMGQWLKRGVIPNEQMIEDNLVGLEYGYDRNGAVLLEKKEDNGDALSLTFPFQITPRVFQAQDELIAKALKRAGRGSTGY